jgi:hypothetical protein
MHGSGLAFTQGKALGDSSSGQLSAITAFYPVDLAGHGRVDLLTHLADGRPGAPILVNEGKGELRMVSDDALAGLDAPINGATAGSVDVFDAVSGTPPKLTERAVVLRQLGSIATPATPSDVEATTTLPGVVHVSWPAVWGTRDYLLRRSGGAPGAAESVRVKGTSWNDTTALPLTAYYYTVAAENGAGASAASAQVRGSRRAA